MGRNGTRTTVSMPTASSGRARPERITWGGQHIVAFGWTAAEK